MWIPDVATRHVVSAELQRPHFIFPGFDKPRVAVALLLICFKVHHQVLYQRFFGPVHLGGQLIRVLELDLIAKLVKLKELPCHLWVNLLQQRAEIRCLARTGEDVWAPDHERHHDTLTLGSPCVCAIAKDVSYMQMAVEPLVKVLPQLIEVFSRVKLLKMHVSRQRCQWLGIGIWETCFVRGKRLIHAFYTEGGVARGLEHFLYKDVERQSPNIPIGFSYIARLRKYI